MTENPTSILQDTRVLLEVGDAMAEQVHDHGADWILPDGTGSTVLPMITLRRSVARVRRTQLEQDGELAWADLLSVAHIEALAVADPAQLREALLRLAATAGLWISALDRQHGDQPGWAAARLTHLHTTEEGHA